MSYDFDVSFKPCDHSQKKERMIISSDDWRTVLYADRPEVRMRGNVSSANTVRLYIGGVEIPRDHEIYGWDLLDDENSIYPERKSKIYFRRQVRLTNLVLEVDYTTHVEYCLKCNGYGQTNDFALNTKGTFLHVTEHPKLLQRIVKFLLTSRCAFYPIFTSKLKEFIGRKFGITLTEEDISYECMTSLENLKNIQIAQKTVQFLSPQEILRDIESVESQRDQFEPSRVKTRLRVSSYGKERVNPLSFILRTRN